MTDFFISSFHSCRFLATNCVSAWDYYHCTIILLCFIFTFHSKVNSADRCICTPGWTGRNCSSEVNECMTSDPSLCLNGATCIDGFLNVTCVCAPFYTGRFCEEPFDPCDPTYIRCENGATCWTTDDGGYNCSCAQGTDKRIEFWELNK